MTIIIRAAVADDIAELAQSLALSLADPDPGLAIDCLAEALLFPSPWCECLAAAAGRQLTARRVTFAIRSPLACRYVTFV